jgi:hypothetical protein
LTKQRHVFSTQAICLLCPSDIQIDCCYVPEDIAPDQFAAGTVSAQTESSIRSLPPAQYHIRPPPRSNNIPPQTESSIRSLPAQCNIWPPSRSNKILTNFRTKPLRCRLIATSKSQTDRRVQYPDQLPHQAVADHTQSPTFTFHSDCHIQVPDLLPNPIS